MMPYALREKVEVEWMLSRILEYVLTGLPNHVDKDLQVCFTKRDELST